MMSEQKNLLVSVVIPVYNEEAMLVASVTELHAKLLGLGHPFEILVSENGSKDRTLELARNLETKLPRLRVLHADEPNYGKALRRGIVEARGTYVLCDEIDICDVEFHRRAIEILTSDGADMVVGSKLHKDSKDERPLGRHLASVVLNGLLRVFLGFHGTDTHGLKAFHRGRLLAVIDRCVVDKDLFASELVIRTERQKLRITEVPITLQEKRPPSINLFRRVPKVLKDLGRLFWVIRVRHR